MRRPTSREEEAISPAGIASIIGCVYIAILLTLIVMVASPALHHLGAAADATLLENPSAAANFTA